MKLKPLADRVLIKPTPAEETTLSGIIIPDSAKEKPLKGEVLAVGEGADLKVGAPYVEGATVTGTADKTGKQKKINIFKMKPKKGYRKRQGHRQPYTKVTIGAINA